MQNRVKISQTYKKAVNGKSLRIAHLIGVVIMLSRCSENLQSADAG